VIEPHRARQIAESFGTDPERYDRTRPRYPDALVEAVVAASPGRDVLDVGIGTGIAARAFRAAGCRVVGVEPDTRMAEFARRDGFEVDGATFETWRPSGRTFDAVVAGQTWHWVDPVAGAEQAARVLRPGGRVALFWNVLQPAPRAAEAFAEVQRRHLPDAPPTWTRPALDAYSGILAKVADGLRGTDAFGEPEQWRFDWERTYTRAEWLDQLPTHGFNTQLPPDTLAELLTATATAVDEMGGQVRMGYAAIVVTAARCA
jgi:SAM-dependent methyltransferase